MARPRQLILLLFLVAFPVSGMNPVENPALSVSLSEPLFMFGTKAIGSHFGSAEGAPNSSRTLWSLGFLYPFRFKALDRDAGLGIFLSGPFGNLASIRAYEPTDLYSLRYGNADSQFQANVGMGVEILPKTLYFGSGVRLYLSGAGNGAAVLSTVNPTGRLALDVGLNSALYSGVVFKKERTQFSATYQQQMNPEFVQVFDGKVPIGGENTFHQPLSAKSYLYFEPHILDLESRYDSGPVVFIAGVSYQLWGNYGHPVLITETKDSAGNTSATTPPDSIVQNTWNPRVGVEVPLLENQLRITILYRYQPTAVADLSGIGNPLDSDTHIVEAAVHFPLVFQWSLFFEQHFFESRTVVKKADATTYTFGGNAFSAGARLGFPL